MLLSPAEVSSTPKLSVPLAPPTNLQDFSNLKLAALVLKMTRPLILSLWPILQESAQYRKVNPMDWILPRF